MNADEIVRALKSNAEVNHHAAVMMMAADLIETLQAQLAASQRRERAAVEDLKDALYDPLTIDCGYCKYRGAETDEHVATTGGCHACENHGGFYDCFEWRGPQDGEDAK